MLKQKNFLLENLHLKFCTVLFRILYGSSTCNLVIITYQITYVLIFQLT